MTRFRPARGRDQGAAGRPLRQPPPPLDAARLSELALAYVARFATSEVRLARYLTRKLRERGWAGAGDDDDDNASAGRDTRGSASDAVAAAVARCADLGFVDDSSFAEARGGALTRRGLGARRVSAQLSADGIAADTAAPVVEQAGARRLGTALAFARRRRLGPFGREPIADAKMRARVTAAFLRAGHDMNTVRRILAVDPGDAAALAELDAADEES